MKTKKQVYILKNRGKGNTSNVQSSDLHLLSSENITERVTGWVSVRDNLYTELNPLLIPFNADNTELFYPILNNAFDVDSEYTTEENSAFYDPNSNKFLPANIGDYNAIKIVFNAKSVLPNAKFKTGINIGGLQGVIFKENHFFVADANSTDDFDILKMGYSKSTFITNGGVPIIQPINSSLEIFNIEFQFGKLIDSQK